MEPALGRFTSVDPLAEKYYSISPYAYCNNNPVKYIDPTGMAYGDCLNDQGDKIGWDGIHDKKLYLVTDNKDISKIKENDSKGKSTSVSDLNPTKRVLSVESIKGDPRENSPFNGTFNESFDKAKQDGIIKDAISSYNGNGSQGSVFNFLIKESDRGKLDFKSTFMSGELINLNGIYINDHEALNYMWGAALSELNASGKAPYLTAGQALLGAQLYHMYDAIRPKGRSEGMKNQENHNIAIALGWYSRQPLPTK